MLIELGDAVLRVWRERMGRERVAALRDLCDAFISASKRWRHDSAAIQEDEADSTGGAAAALRAHAAELRAEADKMQAQADRLFEAAEILEEV